MTLLVDVRHKLGAFELETSFEARGRLIALFGSSGSGKTAIVNLIAGITRPDRGRIVADGRVLVDSENGVFLPKHRRRMGYVFQDARLFPHLTVSQNLRYGRWFTPPSERYADMEKVVELLGIGHLADRRPNLLSGGEKQRVAIGRALIASPRLILMDEPLAALDDARKAEIMPYIERLRDEMAIPIVYVSHSLAEVARLSTDVVVVSAGRVTACGPTGDIMQRLDLMPEEERAEGGAVLELEVVAHEDAMGLSVLGSRTGPWRVRRIDAAPGSRVRIRVRARDVLIATRRPQGLSAINISPGTVLEITPDGPADALVRIDCGGDVLVSRITRHSLLALDLAPGKRVFAVVKAVALDRSAISQAVAPVR